MVEFSDDEWANCIVCYELAWAPSSCSKCGKLVCA